MLYAFSISKQRKYTPTYFLSSPNVGCMDCMDSKLSINRKLWKNQVSIQHESHYPILTFLLTSLANLHRAVRTGGECSQEEH